MRPLRSVALTIRIGALDPFYARLEFLVFFAIFVFFLTFVDHPGRSSAVLKLKGKNVSFNPPSSNQCKFPRLIEICLTHS